jgi:sugar lactone lactonase YvrE
MMTLEATCLWDLGAELGEGPIWSAAEQAVWFVDIKLHKVHRLHPESGERTSWDAPDQIGFLAPVAGGGFIAGLKSGLHRFDPTTGSFTLFAKVEEAAPDNRLNDGFVDGEGRLWFGTMDDGETRKTGALHRLGADGRPVVQDTDYAITNGPTVSPDGRTLYHVDTRERLIWAFDLSASGELSNKRLFVRITRPGAHPDGPAMDSQGCLWAALFGGWGADRYSPTGELIGRVELPVSNVTKIAFGGPDLKTLFITTARLHLTPEQRAEQPLAGGLFTARADVAGLAQTAVRLG